MSIKLKGSTDGSVSLEAPADTSPTGTDKTLILPTGVGSADDVLKNGSTPGTLEFGPIPTKPGQVIEQISTLCNGRSVTVGSGTYTIPSVTAVQYPGDSFVDVTGSSFTYTPPSGTNTVIYEFKFHIGYYSTYAPLGHFKFFLDSTEVTAVRESIYGYYDTSHIMRVPLSLNNSTEDIANGKVGSWTSNKTMKVQARRYTSSFPPALHRSYYWEGTGNPFFTMPTLEITSIA